MRPVGFDGRRQCYAGSQVQLRRYESLSDLRWLLPRLHAGGYVGRLPRVTRPGQSGPG